jgi:hypothetical protein
MMLPHPLRQFSLGNILILAQVSNVVPERQ